MKSSAIFPLAVALCGCAASYGKNPGPAERTRFVASPQFDGDKKFTNPNPMYMNLWAGMGSVVSGTDHRTPEEGDIPVVKVEAERFDVPPESGLRITWLGHSTLIIEVDGQVFLTDPIWSERSSPYQWTGPKRWYESPLAWEDVPLPDAVLISHDHYDHLDHRTIVQMKDWNTRFIVPLGVGSHLRHWGVPDERIEEFDWWEEAYVGGVKVACVPARHASGRTLARDHTLWAGYALIGPKHRAYFSGDTGMFEGFLRIGEVYGPFDVTMIESGAYGEHWPDWHLGPEQAVVAHQMVRGRFLLPIHWGLFNLAAHAWTEPAERVLRRAHQDGVSVAVPRPGESWEVSDVREMEKWWPEVPFESAEEAPIIATESGDKEKRLDLNELRSRSRR